MSFRITTVPGNRHFVAQDGETILQAAQRNGLHLSYGCRSGTCGTCKGRVLQGTVDFGQFEPWILPSFEREQGRALFCQAKPLTDLTIEALEVAAVRDIDVRRVRCRVERIIRAAPEVMVLILKPPSNERFEFLAGQYLDILLADGKRRSFSLANAPHDNALLELHVRNYGGEFSQFVFNGLKEKALLRVEGPLGTCFLREDSQAPVIFMAGGTGFAPVKSMIERLWEMNSARPVHFYWGARSRADLYMAELAQRWQQEHANFTLVPVLSHPEPADQWSGRTGLVHQAILDDFDDLSQFQLYACGPPAMVAAGQTAFTTERGLPAEQFYSDPFTVAADAKA